jgi:hypothetical protein
MREPMALTEQTKARLGVVLTLVAAPLLFFHRATFSDDIFISRDILRVYYPLRQYWVERVSQLQFPDWYPYDALGQPYVGMVISGTFHPTNLLYLLLPLGQALKVVTLLSYMVAMGGTYRFARLWSLGRGPALLAGLTYGLCGYMVGISNNQLYLLAAATFPWALWAAERFFRERTVARAALAALFVTLVLLSGDSQSFALTNGLVLLLALLRPGRAPLGRALLHAGALIGLSALLSAVQLLPVRPVLAEGVPGGATLDIALRFSLHPLRLAELLLGPLFVNPDTGTAASLQMADVLLDSRMKALWVDSIQLGAPALLLLAAALGVYRRSRSCGWMVAVALGFLLLALGKHLPLYAWVYELVPLWRPFRYPEKLLPYFLFLCALGAGVGLAVIQGHSLARRRLGLVALGVAVLCGVLALLEGQLQLYSGGVLAPRWPGGEARTLELLGDNFVRLNLQAAGVLVLMALLLLGVQRPELRMGLLIGLQLGVLYAGNQGLYQVSFPTVLEEPTGFTALILEREGRTGPGGARVFGGVADYSLPRLPDLNAIDSVTLTLAMSLAPNTPAIWALESGNVYLPAASRRAAGLNPESKTWLTYFAGLYSVRYITMGARGFAEISGNRSVLLAENELLRMVLLNNPRTLPRAYLATALCAPDEASVYRFILSKEFKQGQHALVECPGAPPPTAPPGAAPAIGQVKVRAFAHETVELDVEATQPALLVLNDAYYSGWSATVDGKPVDIRPTNIAVRGVEVPAGMHQVVFRYRTPGLLLGLGLSLGTLLCLAMAALVERRRRLTG